MRPRVWTDRLENGILARIGLKFAHLKFAHLKASSANIERTFPSLKLIQGLSRVNLSMSSLVSICRVKMLHDVILEDYELEELDHIKPQKESDDDQANRSQEESSSFSLESPEITEVFVLGDCTWLQDECREAKLNYQAFFRCIDFNVIGRSPAQEIQEHIAVSDEEIREMLNSARASHTFGSHVLENYMPDLYTVQNNNLSYDTSSQIAEYDNLTSTSQQATDSNL